MSAEGLREEVEELLRKVEELRKDVAEKRVSATKMRGEYLKVKKEFEKDWEKYKGMNLSGHSNDEREELYKLKDDIVNMLDTHECVYQVEHEFDFYEVLDRLLM